MGGQEFKFSAVFLIDITYELSNPLIDYSGSPKNSLVLNKIFCSLFIGDDLMKISNFIRWRNKFSCVLFVWIKFGTSFCKKVVGGDNCPPCTYAPVYAIATALKTILVSKCLKKEGFLTCLVSYGWEIQWVSVSSESKIQ